MGDNTDGALARRAAAGDRETFATLLERHYDRFYRVGACVLDDPDERASLALPCSQKKRWTRESPHDISAAWHSHR